ncbi:transmembrane protein 165 [Galendromus occidentalis]|uniref:GDT1 family protein n=1 Tax=Galendromus occidentalis TaxID=34638 RepID=A0AAJ6QRM6_9ACAR|nr:transmembrane protein 165 [Galendromus occidentalis]
MESSRMLGLLVICSCLLPLLNCEDSLPDSVVAFESKMKPTLQAGTTTTTDSTTPNFWHGFVSSLSVIIVSEIGDKTFFIAAIMSMRHKRLVVFAGAITALIIMTILSAMAGSLSRIIPRVYTHYMSIFLFVAFGVKMLYEASQMADDEGKEEFEEVEKTLNQKEMENTADIETGQATSMQSRLYTVLSRVFWQALTLTFVAEWGDRSQLATIILAASENIWAVNLGAITGHSLCTCFAVMAGSVVAKRVSVRTVTIVGGIVFLLFAVSAYVIGIDKSEVTV